MRGTFAAHLEDARLLGGGGGGRNWWQCPLRSSVCRGEDEVDGDDSGLLGTIPCTDGLLTMRRNFTCSSI